MKQSVSSKTKTVNGATTLIAADAVFRGEIRGNCKTVVLGQIVGDCDVDGSVTVAAGGHWKGTLKVGSLTVAGTIEGDIYAKDAIRLEQTAKVAGTISCLSLRVAAGAVVDGLVTMRLPGR